MGFLARMAVLGCDNPIGAAPTMTAAGPVMVAVKIDQSRPVVKMAVAPARTHVVGVVPVRSARCPNPKCAVPTMTTPGPVVVVPEIYETRAVVIVMMTGAAANMGVPMAMCEARGHDPIGSVPVVAAPRAVVVPPERNQPGTVVVVMVAAPHAHVARLIVMMAPRRTVMAVVKSDCKATAMAAG